MNVSFERGENRTDEWFTPEWVIEKLVKAGAIFDLDPCTSDRRPFDIAKNLYTKEMDGLNREWHGCVWCNPPYSKRLIIPFIKKLAQHGNGIALIFNRMDNALWHDVIFPTAHAMLIIRGRLRFIKESGIKGESAGCGSVLVAYGNANASILKNSGIKGQFIELKKK